MIEQHLSIHNFELRVLQHLKKKWNSKIKHAKEFHAYEGKPLPKENISNPLFMQVMMYVGELFQGSEWYSSTPHIEKMDERIKKELSKWESEGELCLHLMVLSYILFEKYEVFTDKEMKLVQGYFLHEAREDNPLAMAMGNIHVGIHAWLSVRGSVIDFTIGQERQFFDFKGMDVIVGEVPEGLTMKGFQEPKKLVYKHLRRYAGYLNMSDEEWIRMHQDECSSFLKDVLSKDQ